MTMMHIPSHSDDRNVLLGREIDEHAREADRVRMHLAALIGGQEGAAAA